MIDKFSRKKLHNKMKKHTSRGNDIDQIDQKIITVDKVLENAQSIEGFMTHLSEGMHFIIFIQKGNTKFKKIFKCSPSCL